jgi:outer membrane protein assembly factor BamB
VDPDGELIRAAERESGFWRPGAGADDLEVVLASNTGEALVFTGTAGTQRWELGTVSAVPTPTAKAVTGEKRLYALLEDHLVYVTELAPSGQDYAPHLNARLSRS